MAFAHSSVIVTGAAVDTRARDQLSFPFTPRPQAMTAYVRFVWFAGDTTAELFLLQIGSLGASNPRLALDIDLGTYRIVWLNAVGTIKSSTVAVGALAVNNRIEMRGVFNADGSVLLGVSVNGGTETLGSTSAAQVIPSQWNSASLMVNSAGTLAVNFCAYRNIEITAGVHTMQEMRRYAGTD